MVNKSKTPKKGPKPQRFCIFCGGGKRSGEHLFSEWIDEFVPRDSQWHTRESRVVEGAGAAARSITEVKRREGDIISSRVRTPCKACNTGWMSRIEARAKPVMTPLILGHLTTLTAEAQAIISTWATLKTIIGESEHRDDKPGIPAESVKQFYESVKRFEESGDRSPSIPNLKVWIAYYEGTNWAKGARYAHCSVYPLDGNAGAFRCQASTFVIGKLFIHVFSATQVTGRGYNYSKISPLMQIYPATGDSVSWSRLLPSLDDGGAAFVASYLDTEINRRRARWLANSLVVAPTRG